MDKSEEDGGPGSGNWGHRGRPGLRGGSGKGGGAQYRGGRSDIAYHGSRKDWLNGLQGERQQEAERFLSSVREFYKQGENANKSVEQCIMEEPAGNPTAEENKQKLLQFMAESRRWDEHADRLIDENLSDEDKKILDALKAKYGTNGIDAAIPDERDMDKWDQADREYYMDLKSKAMDGPVSGKEAPDELQYAAGLKERPKAESWVNGIKNNENYITAELSVNRVTGRYVNLAQLDKDQIDDVEKEMFKSIMTSADNLSAYQKDRGMKQYLRAKIDEMGGLSYDNIPQECYDRLQPLEQAQLQEILWDAKRRNETVLGKLDYAKPEERLENYALLNKALGGADMVNETHEWRAERFRKQQEERQRQLEEAKRKAEERKRQQEEQERLKKEAEARRAPLIQAAKDAIRNDGVLNKINEATSTKEAADAISIPGMFNERRAGANFDGMDLTVAKRAAEAYSSLYQDYPFLVGQLGAPRTLALSYETYAQSHTHTDGTVEFNTQHYGNLEKLKKSYDSSVASGFHPAGTDYTSIAYHELAHSMDGYLSRKLKTGGWGTKDTVSYDLCWSVKKALGIGGKIGEFRRMTSGYADTQKYGGQHAYKEWFTETFAEAYCSRNPRPIAIELRRQLDQLIKDNGLEGKLE